MYYINYKLVYIELFRNTSNKSITICVNVFCFLCFIVALFLSLSVPFITCFLYCLLLSVSISRGLTHTSDFKLSGQHISPILQRDGR